MFVFLPKANQLGMKKRNHKIQHLVTPAMMPFPVDIDKKSHEPNHPKSMIFEVVASETEPSEIQLNFLDEKKSYIKHIYTYIYSYYIMFYEWKTAVFNSPSPPSQAPSPQRFWRLGQGIGRHAHGQRAEHAAVQLRGLLLKEAGHLVLRPRRRGGSFTVKGRS
jgi:hypothetical protein